MLHRKYFSKRLVTILFPFLLFLLVFYFISTLKIGHFEDIQWLPPILANPLIMFCPPFTWLSSNICPMGKPLLVETLFCLDWHLSPVCPSPPLAPLHSPKIISCFQSKVPIELNSKHSSFSLSQRVFDHSSDLQEHLSEHIVMAPSLRVSDLPGLGWGPRIFAFITNFQVMADIAGSETTLWEPLF